MKGRPSSRALILSVVTIGLITVFAAVVEPRFHAALATNIANHQDDFHTFYRTARCLFVEPCDPYLYIVGVPPNLAPPHAHVLLVPVMLLPKFTAYTVWMAISLAALVAVTLRFRQAGPPGLGTLPAIALMAAVAGSSLMMATVASGQIYATLAWPVTEAWLALRSNKMTRAAILLGLTAAVKPTMLLPIPWLWIHGRRRAAVVATATFALAYGIGVLYFGRPAYAGWLNTMAHLPREGHFRDGSILGTLVRAFTPGQYLRQAMEAPGLVFPLWAALSGLLVSITLLRPLSPDRAWLALLSCACLVAPKGWIYAGWWLLFPGIAVWRSSASSWTRGILLGAGVLLWLPDTAPMWGQPNGALTLTWGSLYLWVWLMIWLASQLPNPARVAA